MEFDVGRVVISKAGRDKGYFLAVVGFDAEGVLVCDGRERPLGKPKRKNPKHLAATSTVLNEKDMAGNQALRKALRKINVSNQGG